MSESAELLGPGDPDDYAFGRDHPFEDVEADGSRGGAGKADQMSPVARYGVKPPVMRVNVDDCLKLVDRLQSRGRAVDVILADRIRYALDHDSTVLGLEPDEREAILAVLQDPPDSLVGLRDALERDQGDGPFFQ